MSSSPRRCWSCRSPTEGIHEARQHQSRHTAATAGYSQIVIVPAGRQVHISGQVSYDTAGKLVARATSPRRPSRSTPPRPGARRRGASFADVFKIVTYVGIPPTRSPRCAFARQYFGDGPFPASTMVGVTGLVDPDCCSRSKRSARTTDAAGRLPDSFRRLTPSLESIQQPQSFRPYSSLVLSLRGHRYSPCDRDGARSRQSQQNCASRKRGRSRSRR